MQLVPGMVLFLWFRTMKPFPKDKFAVLCCLEPSPIFLLINSDQNTFIVNTPELVKHHLPVDAASHPFLSYDSWLDCSAPFGYDTEELLNALRKEPARVRGKLSQKLIQDAVALISTSDLWTSKKMARVVEGLMNAVPVEY